MNTAKTISNGHCQHSHQAEPSGLALITVGNSLRGDDGIGSSLCDVLPESVMKDVCRFDLGSYTGYLHECLVGHKAAIIIDSTKNGTAPGTVSLMDLAAMLDRATVMNVSSCHGFSLADELRIAKHYGTLPKRLIFFGVEVDAVDWTERLSSALEQKLPQLVQNLSVLVSKVVETLKRNA